MDLEKLKEVLKNDKYFYSSWNNILTPPNIANLHRSNAPGYLQRSVTQRISEIKQPRGGYLPIKLFTEHKLTNDNLVLEYRTSEDAQRFASLMGLVVDYVSRYLYSKNLIHSFEISYLSIVKYLTEPYFTTRLFSEAECLSLYHDFKQKLFSIEQLDIDVDNKFNIEIIKNIFIIVQLDGIYRAGYEPEGLWEKTSSGTQLIFNKHREIPDYICNNAITCIRRALAFYNSQKEIVFGESFTNGELIAAGDCDFISHDTIWDMKVSSINIHNSSSVNKWTLQVLIYYLMLKHPTHHNFSKYINVKNVGIFNPYLNVYYVLDVDKLVDSNYIKEIEDEIIGIDWKPTNGYRIDNIRNILPIKEFLMQDYPAIKIYSRNNSKE